MFLVSLIILFFSCSNLWGQTAKKFYTGLKFSTNKLNIKSNTILQVPKEEPVSKRKNTGFLYKNWSIFAGYRQFWHKFFYGGEINLSNFYNKLTIPPLITKIDQIYKYTFTTKVKISPIVTTSVNYGWKINKFLLSGKTGICLLRLHMNYNFDLTVALGLLGRFQARETFTRTQTMLGLHQSINLEHILNSYLTILYSIDYMIFRKYTFEGNCAQFYPIIQANDALNRIKLQLSAFAFGIGLKYKF